MCKNYLFLEIEKYTNIVKIYQNILIFMFVEKYLNVYNNHLQRYSHKIYEIHFGFYFCL